MAPNINTNSSAKIESQLRNSASMCADRIQPMSMKLAKLRKRHLPSHTQNKKRKYADKLLQRILRELDVDLHQLEDVIEKWEFCGSKYERYIPTDNGFEWRKYKWNCKLPFCQRCNAWMKKKEAEQILDRFTKLIGDAPLEAKHFSAVTINGPVLPLGSDFVDDKQRMATKIRYRIKKLMGSVLQGEFEIAKQKQSDEMPYQGKLHLHGIMYHPNQSRDEVRSELKLAFPDKRAVQIKRTYTERDGLSVHSSEYQYSLHRDIKTYAQYSCDVDIRVSDDKEQTGQVLFNHLLSICSIWSGGKRGLRFQPGLRAAFKQRGLEFRPSNKSKLLPELISDLLIARSNDDVFHSSNVLKEELVAH